VRIPWLDGVEGDEAVAKQEGRALSAPGGASGKRVHAHAAHPACNNEIVDAIRRQVRQPGDEVQSCVGAVDFRG